MTGMTDDGFYSYWYMPFAKSAVVELVNEDDGRPQASSSRSSMPRWGGRLTAWATSTPSGIATRSSCPPTAGPTGSMLQTAGPRPLLRRDAARLEPARRLVGRRRREVLRRRREVPLHLRHRLGRLFRLRLVQSAPVPEAVPRPDHDPDEQRGHQSVLRWHIVDNVPFQKSFEGCIEKYFKNDHAHALRLHRAAGTSRPAAAIRTDAVPVAQRDGYYVDAASRLSPASEVLNVPPGELQVQEHGATSARASGRTTSSSGGPAPAQGQARFGRAGAKAGKYEVMREPHQGPRLRHRAALAGRPEGRRADRPLPSDGGPQRPDRAGHLRAGRRVSTS